MRFAAPNRIGRIAAFLAWLATPGYKDLVLLSYKNRHGFIHPFATVNHPDIRLGRNVYIDYNAILYRAERGGPVQLNDYVRVMRGSILETGDGGSITVGEHSWLHPNAHLIAYLEPILIGKKVLVAPNSAFYPHNHGVESGMSIFDQPCVSKGPIIVGDGSWLGTGVTVLGGVTIGEGAVIGAGSVVSTDIPANAIAGGMPAKVLKYRNEDSRCAAID
jgi:acetyltransferase-like isoleucine patch superfamily enzyme